MPSTSILDRDGATVDVDAKAVEALRAKFGDRLLEPSSPGYDDARAIWNAMIDKKPALICKCKSTDDVVAAVGFARDNKLLVAVRGAGHNIAGNAVCDGGFVIDLSLMKQVTVDASARTAVAGGGVTLGELDAATQEHGLATPLGINSTTGIAGLTLGGGFGWLSRKLGMTIDNLLSAEVVTADGKVLTASEKDNADLFWALRGGGGNFGVVTSFTYRLHPVGPEVLAGLVVHPGDQAVQLIRQYRDLVAKAPDDLTVWVVLRKAPPLPFLPEEWHGKDVLVFAMVYASDMKAGEAAAAPFRALGKPIADVVGPHPYTGFQQALDPLLTPGFRNYWKSHNFDALSDDAIDTLVSYSGKLPTGHSEVFIGQLGGATSRVARDATAYQHRSAQFFMNVHTRWESAADDALCVDWARSLFKDMRPFATGGVYVNFMPDDEVDRISEAYGENYERLAAIKSKYDPNNMWRLNQNITPATVAG